MITQSEAVKIINDLEQRMRILFEGYAGPLSREEDSGWSRTALGVKVRSLREFIESD